MKQGTWQVQGTIWEGISIPELTDHLAYLPSEHTLVLSPVCIGVLFPNPQALAAWVTLYLQVYCGAHWSKSVGLPCLPALLGMLSWCSQGVVRESLAVCNWAPS